VFGITFALEKAVKALRGSIGRLYTYSFFIFGARWGCDVKDKTPAALIPGKKHGTDCT
jgi:hypothetical protein